MSETLNTIGMREWGLVNIRNKLGHLDLQMNGSVWLRNYHSQKLRFNSGSTCSYWGKQQLSFDKTFDLLKTELYWDTILIFSVVFVVHRRGCPVPLHHEIALVDQWCWGGICSFSCSVCGKLAGALTFAVGPPSLGNPGSAATHTHTHTFIGFLYFYLWVEGTVPHICLHGPGHGTTDGVLRRRHYIPLGIRDLARSSTITITKVRLL